MLALWLNLASCGPIGAARMPHRARLALHAVYLIPALPELSPPSSAAGPNPLPESEVIMGSHGSPSVSVLTRNSARPL
jgi:hypothetical protein